MIDGVCVFYVCMFKLRMYFIIPDKDMILALESTVQYGETRATKLTMTVCAKQPIENLTRVLFPNN